MERYQVRADGSVYFVTYSVVEWLPVFISDAACRIVTDSLTYCHDHKGLRINAWVIMPTHLHAIVFHESFRGEPLRSVLADFRKFTGRSLSDFCETHLPRCFSETLNAAAGADRERRFWQPTRHPEVIETPGFYMQKSSYLLENPCRKGLVRRAGDWRYSSAAWALGDGRDVCDVPMTRIEW